jgi:hypothetical protein
VAPDPRLNEEGCLMKRGRLMKNKQGIAFLLFSTIAFKKMHKVSV